MADNFETYRKSIDGPADIHYTLTASDSVDLAQKPRGIICTTAGDAVIRDADGTDITYTLTLGQLLPFRPTRLLSTGTTAVLVGWE